MTLSSNSALDYRQVRLNKLKNLSDLGFDVYPSKFDRTITNQQLHQKYKDLQPGEETENFYFIAGRIMSIRNSGMFIDLVDETGKIQVFSHQASLPENFHQVLKNLDIGDIIGVSGYIRCTPRGELTINSSSVALLSKSLLTLPEKYHGLHDVETRYRQRYVDLIVNPTSKETLLKRCKIITEIRNFLNNEDFLEVETPMLHSIPGGAIAKPFVTYHNTLDMQLFLRIAPELYLKKLLVGGLSNKIYEINRCFRNEGISTRHNPEFTSVEIYHTYVDYNEMINLTERLVNHLVDSICLDRKLKFAEIEINFLDQWPRKSMSDIVLEHTGVDFKRFVFDEEARKAAKQLGVHVENHFGWGKSLEAVFAEKVEHTLTNPIHITHLPTEISPLAKVSQEDPRVTDRFESYINCWEVANGFSELNDPIEQMRRFESQVAMRENGDDEAHLIDNDFLTALEYALPPTGGLGIGIDRLVMILTNSQSIREVIAFPTLRHKED